MFYFEDKNYIERSTEFKFCNFSLLYPMSSQVIRDQYNAQNMQLMACIEFFCTCTFIKQNLNDPTSVRYIVT